MYNQIYRGQIYYADLEPSFGSEQDGIRPVLIIQNDMGNKYSPTTIIVAITARIHSKQNLPTHHRITASVGLKSDSIVLLEQIRTIDKKRLKERMGELETGDMSRVNNALSISFGLL